MWGFQTMNFFNLFPRARLWLALAAAALLLPSAAFADLNPLILQQLRAMPGGGRYSVQREATQRLCASVRMEAGALRVAPAGARPSYCSGATYLVFLKTVEALQAAGRLHLDPTTLEALLIRGQPDGHGIWGRWNANGPGTARLFHELGLGRNFDDYEEARPGDFMKIFWTPEVGRLERGHSVIYLGRETKGGVEMVRFWSSNQPDGYGEKAVPRSKIAYALFSRLEHPEALARSAALPARDPYLASLLSTRSSVKELRAKSGL